VQQVVPLRRLCGAQSEFESHLSTMRRLIYDMYYAEEISIDIAIKLLDKLTQIRDKKRY